MLFKNLNQIFYSIKENIEKKFLIVVDHLFFAFVTYRPIFNIKYIYHYQ